MGGGPIIIIDPTKPKRAWQSKTVLFSWLLMVLGVIIEAANLHSGLLAPYFGQWGGLFVFAVGVIAKLLRLVTVAPIAKPEPPQ